MTDVIGVRFKRAGKIYYFDPSNLVAPKHSHVIVETARGVEYGEVMMEKTAVEDDAVVRPLKGVIRVATADDAKTVETNEKLEREAFTLCNEKIRLHKLEMNLVAVQYTFDRGKILFYFTAEGRVDFRELVKDLASIFRTRIELRQIGVRDEAKMLGGLGICGCPLCCATFLDDFAPVSINMAKDQGISLNPTKISGSCGRLMCCLKYENEAYQDMIKTTPCVDSIVQTPNGQGVVTEALLVKGQCRVKLDGSTEPAKCYCKGDCKMIKEGKPHQKRDSRDHREPREKK